MNEQQEWIIYFAGIAAIRFHPRNVPPGETLDEDELNELDLAAACADEMLRIRRERWQDGEQLQQPQHQPLELGKATNQTEAKPNVIVNFKNE